MFMTGGFENGFSMLIITCTFASVVSTDALILHCMCDAASDVASATPLFVYCV